MPDRAERTGSEIPARPTMKDVAAAAGVGLKTVSRVVNGEPGVSEETADRVHAAIRELGFRRNDGARLLRQGSRTSCVGLILEDLADPFYAQLSRAVEEVARSHGSLLFTGSSAEDPARERELTLDFCARRVDGLIVVPTAADHGFLAPELAAGTAVVSIDRPMNGLTVDTVLAANRRGAAEAVGHLIRQGHRRIGYLGDDPEIFTAAERLAGYRQAMAEAGHGVDEAWLAMGRPEPVGIHLALDRMLSGPDAVTALMCGNNRTTVAVLRSLATRPGRTALVGFDDFELADMLPVPVTVVAQDPMLMGRMAAELLFRRMRGERAQAQRLEIPTRLVLRGSGELRF
ncbi:LacI family DNA-binding transcriptional regulator [Kitasatospora sp. NPDC058032]|uniref:LacI family DNA-binding transcriptional regulator n=1 Tax=Kitasatospora sp. NPDC058032 TaxID=3346307 RepID=UPI0036D80C57